MAQIAGALALEIDLARDEGRDEGAREERAARRDRT
jgi:hypothetical protein